ncbi:50S ribosomal protein L6 [Candidatus Roizmanbacteria bacterium CG10_big_fil_rev_8_21_14_0_10_45_7]|uniref:Large ribosomal subunit protein uL6 n=1 Tax=Candidatus Roizmanbacteria bacterium CG10_big_fil_rev_8_21_14_0_10_45_7 TaxID=1974854 RepID=A0A2M8KU91_9BACT|nr:MAG: 50S ribosomal protein L6 [Candidatus Roizmanbacteria bacterium CG10_big_fil_rev_8_21_14_0_10_45_7]
MSKIGKQPVILPEGTSLRVEGSMVHIQGPKGALTVTIPPFFSVTVADKTATVAVTKERENSSALHGLHRTLLANAVKGVTAGWEKVLEIQGTGYRGAMEGANLVLRLGFSHQVTFTPPEGIGVALKGNKIMVTGIDKQQVGEVAASVKRIRPPDHYKGKGIRYVGEVIRIKPGKKAKAAV